MNYKNHKRLITVSGLLVLVAVVIFIFFTKKDAPSLDEKQSDTIESTSDLKQEVVENSYKGFSESVYVSNIEKNILNKDYSVAEKIASEALSFYPKSESILNKMLIMLGEKGDIGGSLKITDTLLEIDSKNYLYWKLKAKLERAKITTYTIEQKKQIQDIYEKALVATSNNIEIISTYAVFAEEYLSKEKAIDLWNLAKKVNPLGAESYQVIIGRLEK